MYENEQPYEDATYLAFMLIYTAHTLWLFKYNVFVVVGGLEIFVYLESLHRKSMNKMFFFH